MAAVHPLRPSTGAARLDIGYVRQPAVGGATLLDQPGLLALIGFGSDAPDTTDPRVLRVPLQPLREDAPRLEAWRVDGPVTAGHDGDLSWSCGGGYLMVGLRVDEATQGGIHAAAAYAYGRLLAAMAEHGHPHLMRAWNYLADINAGAGDDERYRHFTVGRALGMAAIGSGNYPAATAIGRIDGVRELVVYALAAKAAGRPVENPRQVSAYRYPRQYGPVAPSFARAMRIDAPAPALLISGTASVVGHASLHDRPDLQIAETLRNLDSLVAAAGLGHSLPAQTWLKAYVRDADDASVMQSALAQSGLAPDRLICLHGDICRTELLVEIDGIAHAGV